MRPAIVADARESIAPTAKFQYYSVLDMTVAEYLAALLNHEALPARPSWVSSLIIPVSPIIPVHSISHDGMLIHQVDMLH